MPTDEEFRREFLVKDVYNFRCRNYLLAQARELRPQGAGRRRQLHDRARHAAEPGPVAASGRKSSGRIGRRVQERWLHTIGNLTLTGYNSELSDRPVQREADDEGRLPRQPAAPEPVPGPARPLERGEIQKRAELLADLALQDLAGAEAAGGDAWPSTARRRRRSATVYTLDDHAALAGSHPAAVRRASQARPEPRRRRPRGGPQAVHRLQADDELRRGRSAGERAEALSSTSPFDELDDPHGLGARRDRRRPLGHRQRRGPSRGRTTSSRTSWRWCASRSSVRARRATKSRSGRRPAVEAGRRAGRRPPSCRRRSSRWSIAPFGTASTRGRAKRSLMFAPLANRSRALFTLSVRDDDRVDLWCASDAFQTFYAPRAGGGRAAARASRARPRSKPKRSRRWPTGSTS